MEGNSISSSGQIFDFSSTFVAPTLAPSCGAEQASVGIKLGPASALLSNKIGRPGPTMLLGPNSMRVAARAPQWLALGITFLSASIRVSKEREAIAGGLVLPRLTIPSI